MDQFIPVAPSRAAELKAMIASSRTDGKGLAFNQASGKVEGVSELDPLPNDTRNTIGKFGTHYRCPV